jgi:anti-sigma B factor antagonist
MLEVWFPVEMIQGIPVVTAPEEIDVSNADGLRTSLLEAASNGHPTLVADMSRTRFCDSAGLHALAAAHQRARAEGGQLRLVISGDAVLRIFSITGMDQVIPSFASLDDALAPASA